MKLGRDAAPASVVNITMSPGGGGEPSRGTKTAGRSDRTVEGVKPEMPRGAPRERGRTRHVRQGPAIRARPKDEFGPSGEIRTMRLLGVPCPPFEGTEKRRANPKPDQSWGR